MGTASAAGSFKGVNFLPFNYSTLIPVDGRTEIPLFSFALLLPPFVRLIAVNDSGAHTSIGGGCGFRWRWPRAAITVRFVSSEVGTKAGGRGSLSRISWGSDGEEQHRGIDSLRVSRTKGGAGDQGWIKMDRRPEPESGIDSTTTSSTKFKFQHGEKTGPILHRDKPPVI